MELKLLEKKEAPLLSRTEVKAELTFENATPSNEQVRDKIASLMSVNNSLVVIKNIYTKFGARKASVNALVYSDENTLKRIEPKIKEKDINIRFK